MARVTDPRVVRKSRIRSGITGLRPNRAPFQNLTEPRTVADRMRGQSKCPRVARTTGGVAPRGKPWGRRHDSVISHRAPRRRLAYWSLIERRSSDG